MELSFADDCGAVQYSNSLLMQCYEIYQISKCENSFTGFDRNINALRLFDSYGMKLIANA